MPLKSGLRIGLIGAPALLGFGCAQIIGADFDKPFQSGGAGGGSTSVSVSATVSSTGGTGGTGDTSSATGTGSTGGTGGTGGTDNPVANCSVVEPGLKGQRCRVYTFVEQLTPGSANHATIDAVLTFESDAPSGYNTSPTSTFTLFKASSSSDNIPLYSCDHGSTHSLAMAGVCENSTLLGYMAGAAQPGHETLVWFNTDQGEGNDHHRALISSKDETVFCTGASHYGTCEPSSLFVPTE